MTDSISNGPGGPSIERDHEPAEQRTFRVTITGTIVVEAGSAEEAIQVAERELIEYDDVELAFEAKKIS